MDRDFVIPVVPGNENMLIELSSEFLQVTPVIHGLLKFSDEARGQGVDSDSSMAGGNDEKEMIFRGRGKRGLIDGDLKIDEAAVPGSFSSTVLLMKSSSGRKRYHNTARTAAPTAR